jgi:hypothetical protein
MTNDSGEKRIRSIQAMASVIREKSQAMGVLVISDHGNEDTDTKTIKIVGCDRLGIEQDTELLKRSYDYFKKSETVEERDGK